MNHIQVKDNSQSKTTDYNLKCNNLIFKLVLRYKTYKVTRVKNLH